MDIQKICKSLKKHKRVLSIIASAVMCLTMLAVCCAAEEPTVTTSTGTSLKLNFDMAQLFSWAQMILDCLMPVLYVTLGVALAFVIANALKSAFGRY